MTELNYSNEAFQPARCSGLFIGIENQLRSEFATWWRTKKWWLNILIWTALIGGMVILLLTSLPEEQANLTTALQIFSLFSWMGTSVGIIIMMQDSVVGEKISGTAEWVLSKPVAPASFIMAKIIANSVAALLTMNLIPNLVVFAILRLWEFDVSLGNFLIGSMVLYLNLLFFLTLTVLSGVIFSSRTPVIGLPIAFLFGQQFASTFSFDIFYVIPYAIANAVGPDTPLVNQLIIGESIWSIWPIIWTGLFSVVFSLVAMLFFEKQEF